VEGAIEIETKPGATERLNPPVTDPIFALIEQVPLFFAFSIPPGATVAMVVSDEIHVAVAVRSCVLLLL
jgi:hypothetical protein